MKAWLSIWSISCPLQKVYFRCPFFDVRSVDMIGKEVLSSYDGTWCTECQCFVRDVVTPKFSTEKSLVL